MDEKQVIDPATVAKTQASPDTAAPAAPAKTVFRFIKTMSPAAEVVLAQGRKIKFYHAQGRDKAFARVSTFETEDAKLAQAIRDAAAQTRIYVFEVKQK